MEENIKNRQKEIAEYIEQFRNNFTEVPEIYTVVP